MSDHTPHLFLSQTGFNAEVADDVGDFDDEGFDFEAEDADDELAVEEERARER